MKRVGLVLGGGGARGLAHVGVLRVLEREKIPFYCISGTSMGAIIGGCYACNPDINSVEKTVLDALSSSLFSRMKFSLFKQEHEAEKKTFMSRAQSFIKNGYFHLVEETKPALLEISALEVMIHRLLPDIDIRDTKIPFACVATDLTHGVEKVFTRGSLRKCVMASASIPGIFPPVVIDEVYFTDGGAVSVTPVKAARQLGADFIIASDVKSRIVKWEQPDKAKEIIARSNYVTGVLLNDIHLKEADTVISPAVKHMHWSEFDKLRFMAQEGEKAAASRVWEIKAKLRYRNAWDALSRFPGFGWVSRWA
jgi:NTE family protein